MRGTARVSRAAAMVLLVLVPAILSPAADAPSPKTVGWRGNWTGLYPQADPPVEWARLARGVVEGMTCQAARPPDGAARAAAPVRDAMIGDWLVIGPFPVADSVKDFDQEQAPGEADLRPAEGEKIGDLAWQRLTLVKKPDYERWGTTELDWVDLAEPLGYKMNHVAYAHAYVHCEQAGKASFVVDHEHGMKVWLNGKVVYAEPKRAAGLGSYVGISRQKQSLTYQRSPKFEAAFQEGWNRVLVKIAAANQPGWRSLRFAHRLVDAAPVPYEEKNLLWATPLPERTNASPVLVGDRIFTPAEPDELICLDKKTGKVLWRRFNGLSDAVPEAERAAAPVFQEKIGPLEAERGRTTDIEKGLAVRHEIETLLVGLDKKKYELKWDGHLASHFAIVGFTTTPVSDGRHVWTFYGQGVVACYDLEGNRQWVRRLEADEVRYSCSPALIGGRLICVFGGMHALDAATGATVWQQPKATSIASLIPATIRGTDVVFTRQGECFRVADGKPLWTNPHIRQGDTGWGAPTVLGDVMYLSWLGISNLIVADFSGVSGDEWKPAVRVIEVASEHRRPNGEWLDRWTAGSPLILDGTFYGIDQYGVFYAVDLASGKTLYKHDVGFDELHHYNAIGVGASATLGGKYIYVIDNQGACAVLAPGPEYEVVAVNRIQTVLDRDWPVPPQEILANGAPVFDGGCMYLRGEQHLYCIGRAPAAGKGAP